MSDLRSAARAAIPTGAPAPKPRPALFRHVMACLEPSPDAAGVLSQAVALARLGAAKLTALRVLPLHYAPSPLADPIEWDLARREANDWLRQLAEEVGAPRDLHRAVLTGPPASSICGEARETLADLAVVGGGDRAGPSVPGLGPTARMVAETFPGSVVIVPPALARATVAARPARRVLALLDGSSQAEAAACLAAAIARSRSAELVLIRAVPEYRLSADGPPDPEDEALCRKLRQRSASSAQARLDALRARLPGCALRSRVRLLTGEEPRRALIRAIEEEGGELVVLSARGLGGDPDLAIGSTADYLIARAATPVLLVRAAQAEARPVAGRAPRAVGAM